MDWPKRCLYCWVCLLPSTLALIYTMPFTLCAPGDSPLCLPWLYFSCPLPSRWVERESATSIVSWGKKNFMPSPFLLLFGWRQYWQWLHCMFTVSVQQLFIHKSKYLSRFGETIVHCFPLQFWDGNDFRCNWVYQQVIFVSLISPITLWVMLL